MHGTSGLSMYAHRAVVVSTVAPHNFVSRPVQLTVGTATRLLLNVTRDYNSTRHVFTCRLLNVSSGVGNEAITLKLNDTAYYSKTNSSGFAQFVFYLSPQANNNQTAFNVVASFGGDSVSTATASMTLLNGTTYAVCTTTQYNSYEPSSNSTSITVMPQTTTGATTLMNQDQLQKDAENKGWLKPPEPMFSLGYPWLSARSVGYGMRLLLNIARDFSSTRPVFTLRLLSSSSAVKSSRTITLKLNDTTRAQSNMDWLLA